MWQAEHVAKNHQGPPQAQERPGETGIATVFSAGSWHTSKAVQSQLDVGIFWVALSGPGLTRNLPPDWAVEEGMDFRSSKGVVRNKGVCLVADRASSLIWELWQLITLNKAFLLTKTASCPNSVLLIKWIRGQSLALNSSFKCKSGSQLVLKLKKWIKKTEGMLPHRLHRLLYCYMAASQIIHLGINLKQKIDKRKKIPAPQVIFRPYNIDLNRYCFVDRDASVGTWFRLM